MKLHYPRLSPTKTVNSLVHWLDQRKSSTTDKLWWWSKKSALPNRLQPSLFTHVTCVIEACSAFQSPVRFCSFGGLMRTDRFLWYTRLRSVGRPRTPNTKRSRSKFVPFAMATWIETFASKCCNINAAEVTKRLAELTQH